MPGAPQSSKTPLIIAIVAVVVVLLLGGGITAAVLVSKGGSDGGSPLADPTSTSTGSGSGSGSSSSTVYHDVPACDDFPASVTKELVPQGSKTEDEPDDSDDTYYAQTECEWDNIDSDASTVRLLGVDLYAFADGDDSAVVEAQNGLSDDESQAKQDEGTTDDDGTSYGSVKEVSGLGEGAFSQIVTVKSDDITHGGESLGMRVGNVVAVIVFDGTENNQTKAMDADEADQGAQKVAKAVTTWLDSCADCAG